MSDTEYEEKPKKRSKREQLLGQLKSSRISTKAFEEFLRVRGGNSTALFSIPPCDIKEPQFKQRYGLIKFYDHMPSYDRFRSIEMPDTTLRCINSLIARDILYSTEFQGGAGGEQQDAPILDRLCRDLGRFTRPRPQQEEEPTYETSQLTEAAGGKFDLAIKVAAHAHIDPEPTDTFQKGNFQGSQGSSGSSSDEQEGLLVQGINFRAASSRQLADLKLLVYKMLHTVEGLRLKVVNDWKTQARLQNLYQPAMYAIDDLKTTTNFSKAYRPPVYLMTQDRHYWYYAILEIDGYIRVKNGMIDPVSLEGFPGAAEVVNHNKFTPSFTRSEVSAQFSEWKSRMGSDDMYIPDDLHPVGRLFLRRVQGYEVPRLSAEQTLVSGQKRYYEGLLKILVGRRVTQWSAEDAIKAWNGRKSLEEKALRTSGLPDRLWPMVLQS